MKLFAAIMLLANITRRISAIALALACVWSFFPSSSTALAQTPQAGSQPQEPEPGVEDNPTRAVFFSVREESRVGQFVFLTLKALANFSPGLELATPLGTEC